MISKIITSWDVASRTRGDSRTVCGDRPSDTALANGLRDRVTCNELESNGHFPPTPHLVLAIYWRTIQLNQLNTSLESHITVFWVLFQRESPWVTEDHRAGSEGQPPALSSRDWGGAPLRGM